MPGRVVFSRTGWCPSCGTATGRLEADLDNDEFTLDEQPAQLLKGG
ncbi:hypothetical protein [Streptomyces doebereineriae]|uniref:Uncharacterized protein n=1 Tax=Streptomyces doebereineriae TaxID=3075528 RepID=A0ABU2VQS0_9ACTN|nr:hypothetical protein [Streptomyces sp. DSM 41640]MDT0487212.1 hypothetical protein [Streptomyces sp. DSM 41640]